MTGGAQVGLLIAKNSVEHVAYSAYRNRNHLRDTVEPIYSLQTAMGRRYRRHRGYLINCTGQLQKGADIQPALRMRDDIDLLCTGLTQILIDCLLELQSIRRARADAILVSEPHHRPIGSQRTGNATPHEPIPDIERHDAVHQQNRMLCRTAVSFFEQCSVRKVCHSAIIER